MQRSQEHCKLAAAADTAHLGAHDRAAAAWSAAAAPALATMISSLASSGTRTAWSSIQRQSSACPMGQSFCARAVLRASAQSMVASCDNSFSTPGTCSCGRLLIPFVGNGGHARKSRKPAIMALALVTPCQIFSRCDPALLHGKCPLHTKSMAIVESSTIEHAQPACTVHT